MNPELEDRLQAHLGADASRHVNDDAGLGAVKKRARRRSLQSRVAVGAFGLAALVGLGSLVPTNETTDSLITAVQPTPATQDGTTESMDTTEPTPTPETTATSVTAPMPFNVVADGNGGFVAPKFVGATQLLRFVRSTDGETWFDAEESALPEGFSSERFRFEDGYFVLELDGAGDSAFPNTSPHLAISEDLLSWDIIDLGFESHLVGPETVEYSISEIAINGDDIAVVVLEFTDINYNHFDIAKRDVCSLVVEPAMTTIGRCDGSLVSTDLASFPNLVQHVLVSRSGAPATELSRVTIAATTLRGPNWRPAIPIPQAETFAVAEYEIDPALVLSDDTATELTELGDPKLLAARSAGDQTLLVVGTDDGVFTVHLSTTGGVVNELLTPLPIPINVGPRSPSNTYRVSHGPAGWAIAINQADTGLIEVERDGWQFSGSFDWLQVSLRSVDGSQQVFIGPIDGPTKPSPSVQLGLFGGVRYFHPVTGELLVELSREEATWWRIAALALDQATFDRTIDVDGWTIGGHPLRGPITLSSPAGVTTEYADGFAFDNDDISDGVETDIRSVAFGNFVLQRADVIRFYDDEGIEVVSLRGREFFDELVDPVLDKIDGASELVSSALPPRFPNDSFVLHSSDGAQWEPVWSGGEQIPRSWLFNVAVGDDEILAVTANDSERVPLDE